MGYVLENNAPRKRESCLPKEPFITCMISFSGNLFSLAFVESAFNAKPKLKGSQK